MWPFFQGNANYDAILDLSHFMECIYDIYCENNKCGRDFIK